MDNTKLDLNVQVRLVEPKNNLLGFASLTFNDAFVVRDISIVQGKDGIFAGMPAKPDETSRTGYRETAFPITSEFRTQLNAAVVEAYHAKVQRMQEQARKHAAPPQLKDEMAQFKAKEQTKKSATPPKSTPKQEQEAR